MKLAQVSNRVAELSEQYQVPEKLGRVSEKVYDTARKGVAVAYRAALEHPRASIGGVIVAAALVGGLLWYMFGDPRHPVERRHKGQRVRARTEKRRIHAKTGARTAA